MNHTITKEQARSMIQDPDWNEMIVTFEKKDGSLRRMRVDPSITRLTAEKLHEKDDEAKTSSTTKHPHLIHVVDVDLYDDSEVDLNRVWRAIDENRIQHIHCPSGDVYTVVSE